MKRDELDDGRVAGYHNLADEPKTAGFPVEGAAAAATPATKLTTAPTP
jgi:hypothetical protein